MGPDGELRHGRGVVMDSADVARLMALMRRGDARTSAESMELRALSFRLNRATAGAVTATIDGERVE